MIRPRRARARAPTDADPARPIPEPDDKNVADDGARRLSRLSRCRFGLSLGVTDMAMARPVAHLEARPSPLVALGVLSAKGASGQATGAQYLARRTSLRESSQRFGNNGRALELRFLLAAPSGTVSEAAIVDEQRQHGDIVFLAMSESRFNCALKSLLWFEHCATAFPKASFYALADDDTYLQLEHFELDLRSVGLQENEHLLYGLVMWYGTYDNATMVPHEAWGGWGYSDAGAVRLRRRIERCREAGSSSGGGRANPCAKLAAPSRQTVARGTLSDVAPFPVVNGPLWAASNSLARALIADPIPRAYLRDLHRTPRVRHALERPGGPRKSNFGCWPVVDTIQGLWMTWVSVAHNLRIRLVNTPFMVQHHPWPATVHGAFSNHSIVLHGLKRERNQKKFRALAERRGAGPFVPFDRTCGSCAALGWSTWPGSAHAGWTCCGCDATRSKADCDVRMGQRGG